MADGYILDHHDLSVLHRVRKRLFEPRTLSADEKRDLANTMDVILSRACPIDEKDLVRCPSA